MVGFQGQRIISVGVGRVGPVGHVRRIFCGDGWGDLTRISQILQIFLCGGGDDKRVIISLSEAVFWEGAGTPHRSLRSLCVVLTINQPLRGCAAAIRHHLGGDAVRGGCAAVIWGRVIFL